MKLSADKHNDACVIAELGEGEELAEAKADKAIAYAKDKKRTHVEVYNQDGFLKLLRVPQEGTPS